MKYIGLVLVVILFCYINKKYWNTFNSLLVNRMGLHSPGKGADTAFWRALFITAVIISAGTGYIFLYLGTNRDPEYFTGLFLLIPLSFLCWWLYRKMVTARSIKELREKWGIHLERKRDFKEIEELFRFVSFDEKERFVTNLQTWEDLNMDQVYSQVDRTLTTPGEQVLYNLLRTPLIQEKKYKERLKWLTLFQMDQKLREKILIKLHQLDRQQSSLLCLLLWKEISFESKYLMLYRVMGAAALLSTISAFFLGMGALLIIIPVFALNYYLHTMAKKLSMGYVSTMGYLHALIRSARDIGDFQDSRIREFTTPLKELASACRKITGKARAIGLESVDVMGIYEYFNIFFLIEARGFQNALEEIKKRREELQQIYLQIGELDALMSIASYRTGLLDYVEPQLYKNWPAIHGINMRHPLIEDSVPNSIILEGKGAIITGSNMSGKTTFLRTLAVTALLAQTICACLADKYCAGYFKIMTSISKRDDLIQGKSYYLVEAESLLEMLKEVKDTVPGLYAIDEILRGTNTVERISAGVEILNYLARQNCLTIVASHDLEIARSFENLYHLYHFSENVGEAGLEFHYRLKEGISKSMNAIKLLKYLGYPEEIVENAELKAVESVRKLR